MPDRRLLFLTIVVLLLCKIASAQVSESEKPISQIKVSQALKRKLAARFNLFAKYQLEKDYKRQFEMIYPGMIASQNCRKYYLSCFNDLDEFFKKQESLEKYFGGIKEIILLSSQKKLSKGRNQIIFSLQIKSDSGISHFSIYLDGFLDNDEWYFSTFYWIDV